MHLLYLRSLFVNGGLIVAGMIMLVAQGAVASADPSSTLLTIGSTIVMGQSSQDLADGSF